jgi:hypothetical protein
MRWMEAKRLNYAKEKGAMKKFEFCIAWQDFLNDYEKYL